MGVSASGARLWHSLGMGPLWRERAPAQSAELAHRGQDAPAQLDWQGLEQAVAACTACELCRSRTQTVFGVGNRQADWMFIGEAPGAEEDARGEPFVGQAGRLLDNMLAAAGLGRERSGEQAVFIANVLKCRPPGNRNPEATEVAACAPFLRRQIELLEPRLIVVMGRFAAQWLLATDASIASLRGRVHEVPVGARRYPVIVTYHPAYLLRNLADKAKTWDDLCLARDTYARLCAVRLEAPAAG
ncbi:Uracil-DNA glycosylase, family 4 [Burkholderiales bacterium]|nr:Uracil-DNA glycosylase, family 4 [Burkholderiales bacterium]